MGSGGGTKGSGEETCVHGSHDSFSDDELCDDDMRVGGEAQLRGMKPALVFLLLATAALASGLLGPGPSPKQIRKRMNWDTNSHDALGVLADVQDGPFDISVPARPAWTYARAGLYAVAKSRLTYHPLCSSA